MTKNEFVTNFITTGAGDLSAAEAAWKANAQHRSSEALTNLVAAFLECEKEKINEKKEIVRRGQEASGYSASTVGHFYNAISFAKEYHRQMAE